MKIIKGLLIFIFVVFVFMPFFNFWVEYPLYAGASIFILYFILQGIETIPYFKRRKENKEREERKKGI